MKNLPYDFDLLYDVGTVSGLIELIKRSDLRDRIELMDLCKRHNLDIDVDFKIDNSPLPYGFDLIFDIKTKVELDLEISRLRELEKMMKENGLEESL